MRRVVPGGIVARALGAVAAGFASLCLVAPSQVSEVFTAAKLTAPPCIAPQAPTGPTGATGLSGTSGKIGATGLSGVSGQSGVSGITGASGGSGISGTSGQSGTSGTSGASGISGTTGTAPLPAVTGYYLVEANGTVKAYGGLTYFGGALGAKHLPAPIVGAAALPNGTGYWLAGAKGGVYNYGAAAFYGSAVHKKLKRPLVAIAATPDGGGYWLTAANGTIYNFGDAPFCGSAVHQKLASPIVAFASTPDGFGYWLVSANGTVFPYGDAVSYAGAVRLHAHGKVSAITPSYDGKGYWLSTTKGSVYNFGDAGFFGSAAATHVGRPVVSMAATADGLGYWLGDANGTVYDYGDAAADGSLVHNRPKPPNGVVAIVRSVTSNAAPFVPLLHHVVAYDISNYQCTKPGLSTVSSNLPGSATLTIIEAAGWLDSANNSCLSAEASYARAAAGASGAAYNLYLFLNAPSKNGTADALSAAGPAGTCAVEVAASQLSCKAYNYGYNGALAAYNYAMAKKVSSQIWWLDVENASLSSTQYSNASAGQYWSNSLVLNDRTINGAYDALHLAGVTVGIYSTGLQYPKIAGNYSPSATPIPIWVAGVPWTNPPYTQSGLPTPAVLATWCAGTAKYSGTNALDSFAGGVPWLTQETPGTFASPFGIDPDYTC